jgi:hypothetical protein
MVPLSGGWFNWNHIKNDPGRQRHRGKAELIGKDETNLFLKKKKIKNRNIQVVHVVHRHFFGQEKRKQEKDEKEDQLCLDRKNDPDGIRTRNQWIPKGYPRISTVLTTRPLAFVPRGQVLTIYT